MKSLKLPKEIEPLLEAAETAEEDTLVFTDRKRPVAALVSLRNVDRESLGLSMNRHFLTIINKARREIRAGKSVSLEAIERKLARTRPNPRIQPTRRQKRRRAADA
jgi:hypothetical protein